MKSENKENKKESIYSFMRFLLKTIGISLLVITAGVISLVIYFNKAYKPEQSDIVSPNYLESTTPSKEKSSQKTMITLYFTQDGLTLKEESTETSKKLAPYEKAKFIIEKLLEGPIIGSLQSSIPEDIKTDGVFIVGKTLIVNLNTDSKELAFKSVYDEMLCVYSIVNSILENCTEFENVQILLNGEKSNTLGGLIDISGLLYADNSLIASTSD